MGTVLILLDRGTGGEVRRSLEPLEYVFEGKVGMDDASNWCCSLELAPCAGQKPECEV